MNDSSQGQLFTITLDDVEPIYTIDTAAIPALTSADIITLTGSSYANQSMSYTGIETISIDSFTGFFKEEFDGRFPDYDRVQEMCKEYPGLDIAYKKFKEVYTMVKEDYDGKERERRGLK